MSERDFAELREKIPVPLGITLNEVQTLAISLTERTKQLQESVNNGLISGEIAAKIERRFSPNADVVKALALAVRDLGAIIDELDGADHITVMRTEGGSKTLFPESLKGILANMNALSVQLGKYSRKLNELVNSALSKGVDAKYFSDLLRKFEPTGDHENAINDIICELRDALPESDVQAGTSKVAPEPYSLAA